MLTETLLGGLCDGLETPKTDEPLMYAGRAGDGKIQVYTRRDDGRLHYSHTEAPHQCPRALTTCTAATTITIECKVKLC